VSIRNVIVDADLVGDGEDQQHLIATRAWLPVLKMDNRDENLMLNNGIDSAERLLYVYTHYLWITPHGIIQ
jgi:hypothetical protein